MGYEGRPILKVLSEFSNSRVWRFPSREALSTAPLKEREGGIRVGQVGNRRTNNSFVIAEPPDIVGSVKNISSTVNWGELDQFSKFFKHSTTLAAVISYEF